MYDIKDTNDYFLITIEGTEAGDILEALAAAYAQPEYHRRNAIWLFGQKSFNVQLNELIKIAKYIRQKHPEKIEDTKRAIVAPPGLNAGFAKVWVEMAGHLPYEVKVFHNLPAAEDWIRG